MADDQKDDKPIFVEGNQDLFQFVIDYHRDRKAFLPINVCKNAVLHELKRFGLEPTPEQIVQDGVAFPSVMEKVLKWQHANDSRKRKASEELFGALIAEAASKKMKECGGGFVINRKSLPVEQNVAKDHVFAGVPVSQLQESDALKDFARLFGYSFTHSSEYLQSTWISTRFFPTSETS
eukprot:Skav214719  [mRNA]  locus=scaffold2250:229084:231664:+ [translate_table: standard]